MNLDISNWNFTYKSAISGTVVILGDSAVEQAKYIREIYDGNIIFIMARRPTVFEVISFPRDGCLLISEGGSGNSEEFFAAQEVGLFYANGAVGAIEAHQKNDCVSLDLRKGFDLTPVKKVQLDTQLLEDQALKLDSSADIGNGMSERQNFYFDVANQLSVAGAYDEAENYYLKADRLSPGHIFILNNRGGNFTRWGKLEDAEKSFRQALRKEPLHKKARKNLGDVLLKLGRNDEALSQYEKALEIDNSYHDAWYGRGNVLLHLENYPEAEDCFRNANRLSPKDTRYLINIGASLAMQQKYRDALTAYQKAYQLDKDNLALKECITYLRSKSELK